MYRSNYEYEAYITRVKDGDTFDCIATTADLGFGRKLTEDLTLRLEGIDTPEVFSPRNEVEREHGRQATDRTRELIEHTTVRIRTIKYKTKHGEQTTIGHRYRAILWFPYTKGLFLSPIVGIRRALDPSLDTRYMDGKSWVHLVWLLKLEGYAKRDEY